MAKSRDKRKGKVSTGEISVSITAKWTGILKTVLFQLSDIPEGVANFSIHHQDESLDVDYQTLLFEDDPAACNLDAFVYVVPVAVAAGDVITVVYPNPDNLGASASITLEGT